MTINPGGVVLLVLGVVAVIVGIRGSQSQTWAALFGRSSKGDAHSTKSSGRAAGGAITTPLGRHPAPAPMMTI